MNDYWVFFKTVFHLGMEQLACSINDGQQWGVDYARYEIFIECLIHKF